MKAFTFALFSICVAVSAAKSKKEIDWNPNTDSPETLVKAPNHPAVNLNLDEATIVKLAEAVLVRIYGEKVLNQKPWIVTENDKSFKIEGTLPKGYWGGVAEIVIRKSDAKIISFTHGK